jgi:Icc-related predicted phosphoesterase
MRIVAISDLHGWLPPDVPDCDLLVIAGDVCPDFRGAGSRVWLRRMAERQADWLGAKLVPWLEQAPAREVVMCWGNHDDVGEVPALVPPMPAYLLTDEARDVQGLRVYGTPWTHFAPECWAFDLSLAGLAASTERIPDDVDLLVTHGPAYGVLDRVVDGRRAGSRALGDTIARVRPRAHVFGHIHEARGQDGISYNVSVLDVQYRPYPLRLATIDL